MITDHREAPARREGVAERGKGARETAQFVIDGDPDRLEEPGEIAGPRSRPEHRPDGVHQVVADGERRMGRGAGPTCSRQPPRAPLVAIVGEDRGELRLRAPC